MSGTSLDGVDGVLLQWQDGAPRGVSVEHNVSPSVLSDTRQLKVMQHAFEPFDAEFRAELLSLNTPGNNELHRAALAGNRLARAYAKVVHALLNESGKQANDIQAIGAHGQTVRHRPLEFDADPSTGQSAVGYTLQLNNPALLAELTGIDVVAEFRTRDLAAGGQGAPLVPAFHAEIFGLSTHTVAVVNIGGISNISILRAASNQNSVEATNIHSPLISGFDCGPGNALMDHWVHLHQGKDYDANGVWAAQGKVIPALLQSLLTEAFLHQTPPKSTGRDLFNATWLQQHLRTGFTAVDVQATLCEFTALAIANDLKCHAPDAKQLWVCGGGALNGYLMSRLQAHLPGLQVASTEVHGLPPLQVEAAAFAWLAAKTTKRETGSLESVTGAIGARVLGAIFPR
ncbi:MAG: anhydro-N-acetylmuramic acid kinase [Limnohabitans sp.]|nr:anhydro-N-acetylmuramic acid kinase [Limnohabitans sp.]